MKSVATRRFWACYESLPRAIQRQTEKAHRLWLQNPSHPSLKFKQVHARRPIVSIRVGLHWRALGVRTGDAVVWFWIGSHAEYDKLIARL